MSRPEPDTPFGPDRASTGSNVRHSGLVGVKTGDEDVSSEEDPPEPDTDEYYGHLRDYVRMVARGEKNALMLDAPPGIGKTFQIMDTLDEELDSDEYVKHSGYCTPVELYHLLHEAREGKVVFLDDIEGLLQNDSALGLLKQATWSEGEFRTVEWKSTSSKIEVEEQFIFEGKIIMCFNETPDGAIFNSLRDRCLPYHIDFTYEERIDLIHEIAKVPYEGTEYEEREQVAGWIERHTCPETTDVNLRTLFHCLDMYRYNPEKWQGMAIELFDMDEEEHLIRELHYKHETVEDAAEEYMEETGNSRTTFFRRKQDMEGLPM